MWVKIKGCFFILLFISSGVYAQNYVNSPYSIYAIGDIIDNGIAYNRAMGGSSIALRPHNLLNYMNPASYTAQDTASFLLQLGFTSRTVDISTGLDNDRVTNMNIDYLIIGFPATKWLNFSIGLTPYSRIQYFFQENKILGGSKNILVDYKGSGGFNEFFIGTGFEIKDYMSIGANAYYLFGSLDRTRRVYLPDEIGSTASVDMLESYIANDFYFKFGIQGYPTLSTEKHNHQFIAGITIDTDSKIDVKENTEAFRNIPASIPSSFFTDTISYIEDSSSYFTLPIKTSIGLAYNLNDKFYVTAEYIQQNWHPENIQNPNSHLTKYKSYRFGTEMVLAPLSIKTREPYYKRIHYRLGGHLTQSYLKLNGKQINHYGISAGIGLPWKNSRNLLTSTTFNITYEYGVRGTTDYDLIREKYHYVTFGLTLHDFWFLKPKYD